MAEENKWRELVASFLRYLVAGGIAFVVDFAVLFIWVKVLDWHYLSGAALGFAMGLLVTYINSNMWVFRHRKLQDKQVAEFTIFTVVGLVGLGLTLVFMWLFVDVSAGLWAYFGISRDNAEVLAKLPTEALVLLWNFGGRKWLLY